VVFLFLGITIHKLIHNGVIYPQLLESAFSIADADIRYPDF